MSVNKVNSDGSLLRVAGGTLYADAPIGTISPFGGSVIPNGYLLCDGAEVLKTAYPELYAVIGDAFGTASASTKFVLPDLRESVPIGVGENDTQTIAAHDTYTLGEFKDDQLQNITGTLRFHAGLSTTTGAFKRGATISGDEMSSDGGSANAEFDASLVARTGTTTHGKQLGVNYIIKAKQVAVPFDVAEYIRNQNVLSDWESITIPTTEVTALTMMYDGYISCGSGRDTSLVLYVDGRVEARSISRTDQYDSPNINGFPFKKGQSIYIVVQNGSLITDMSRVAYYKLRDYSGR